MDSKAFIDSLDPALNDLSSYCSTEDINLSKQILSDLINGGGQPEDYFNNFRGSGSYKEAWQIGQLCIKFAIDSNGIDAEIESYDMAAKYNISKIFCPTVMLRLPSDSKILLTRMERQAWKFVSNTDERYDCEETPNIDGRQLVPHYAAYLVLQPIAGLVEHMHYATNAMTYATNPLEFKDGRRVPIDIAKRMDAPLEWQQCLITKYGDAEYLRIIDAIEELEIVDLHHGNVAWLGDCPVIIDWTSFGPSSL